MDPLSISTACLTVLSATISCSRAILTAFYDFDHLSDDLKQITQAVQTLQPMLDSLAAQLTDINCHESILNNQTAIEGAIKPLKACHVILQQLLTKLNMRSDNDTSHSKRRIFSLRIKWAMFTKREVIELCKSLDSLKSTLNIALLQLVVSKLFSTGSGITESTIVPRNLGDVNLINDLSEPAIQPSKLAVILPSSTTGSDTGDLSVVGLLHHEEQEISALKDQTLSEVRNTILARERSQPMVNESIHSTVTDLARTIKDVDIMHRSVDPYWCSGMSTPDEVFFDCLTSVSEQAPSDAVERFLKRYSGSADYYFERGSSFYPEQYSCRLLFTDKLLLVASTRSQHQSRTYECFFYYAARPRHWNKVHSYLTFNAEEDNLPEGLIPEYQESFEVHLLPSWLNRMLLTILQESVLVESVTSLCLPLYRNADGSIQCSIGEIRTQEDYYETALANEAAALEQLRMLGCRFFLEQDLITLRRGYANMCYVTDGQQEYVEHKARFVHAAQKAENGFELFFADLLKTIQISKCSGVGRFVGTVLDPTGNHIRGYLCESGLSRLINTMADVQMRDHLIPRDLRRYWARQLINGVRNIHKAGLVIGKLEPAIDSNINLVLHLLWSSTRMIYDREGRMPPELRNSNSISNLEQKFTQETDIFQLGLMLWRLSEHQTGNKKYFCKRSNCASKHCSQCVAEHSNPVALPFSDSTDELLREMIAACRSRDPSRRPTAEEIANAFIWDDEMVDIAKHKTYFQQILHSDRINTFWSWCCQCYEPCTSEHYQCMVCNDRDFALCAACYAKGLYCLDRTHHLHHVRVDQAGNRRHEGIQIMPLVTATDT